MPETNRASPTIKVGRDFKMGNVSGQVIIGTGNNQYKDCTFVLPDGSTMLGKLWSYTQGIRPTTDPNNIFGRHQELKKIDEIFRDNQALAIIGLEGIGKSTVASKYVDQLEEKSEYAGIYWRKIDENIDISDVVGSFFTVIGKPIANLGSYKLEDQLSLFFKELATAPYFLVFDNFQTIINPQTNEPLKPGFSDLIEKANEITGQSRFLFTCWECPVSDRGIRPTWYNIGGLDSQAAIKLLRTRGLTASESELAKAVEFSGGHPLALILLIQLVKKEEAEKLSQALADNSLWEGEVAENILDKVYKQLSEEERLLLRYVSIYREPIPIEAVVAAAKGTNWTEFKARKGALNLTRKSLLNKTKENYWEESLIRNFVLDNLAENASLHKLACEYYLSIPLPKKLKRREDVQPLIEAHYHAFMAEEFDKAAEISLDKNLLQNLEKWGNYRLLVELCGMLLPKDHFKDKPLLTEVKIHGVILGNLGVAYRDLSDAPLAIKYYEKALEIAQQTGDKQHENTWMGQIGIANDDLAKYQDAIEWYRKALTITQQMGDEGKLNENRWLADIGVAYYNLGKYEDAYDYYKKAIEIAKQIGEKRLEGRWTGDIGCLFDERGEYGQAIDYYKRAIEIAQLEDDKRDEGTWLGYLGITYCNSRNYKDALESLGKALSIAQQIGDKQHENMWLGALGSVHSCLGNAKKAFEYDAKALEIARQIGDKRNEGILLTTLGNFFSTDESKYEEALACYLLAKKTRTNLGNAQQLAQTESNIKHIEDKLGKTEFNRLQAEVVQRAEEIIGKILYEART
jgi:tetratricopeptide (TPR) repeat protein